MSSEPKPAPRRTLQRGLLGPFEALTFHSSEPAAMVFRERVGGSQAADATTTAMSWDSDSHATPTAATTFPSPSTAVAATRRESHARGNPMAVEIDPQPRIVLS